MAKRTHIYFQNEPVWLAESFLTALIVFGGQIFGFLYFVIGCLRGFPDTNEGLAFFISISIMFTIVPLLMYPEVISRFSWNVHLNNAKVWMKGDRIAAKWFRVQLSVELYYSEITSMAIEYSSKNSSGQSIRAWFYGPIWSKKRYLALITDRGKKKRLHVSHYTDAALAEIIDEIATRCEKEGNKYDGRRAAQIMFGFKNLN